MAMNMSSHLIAGLQTNKGLGPVGPTLKGVSLPQGWLAESPSQRIKVNLSCRLNPCRPQDSPTKTVTATLFSAVRYSARGPQRRNQTRKLWNTAQLAPSRNTWVPNQPFSTASIAVFTNDVEADTGQNLAHNRLQSIRIVCDCPSYTQGCLH